jgi:hypothetical protein
MPEISITVDDRKYIWDNAEYPDKSKAESASAGYSQKGFETQIISESGKFFIYTRRVVEAPQELTDKR